MQARWQSSRQAGFARSAFHRFVSRTKSAGQSSVGRGTRFSRNEWSRFRRRTVFPRPQSGEEGTGGPTACSARPRATRRPARRKSNARIRWPVSLFPCSSQCPFRPIAIRRNVICTVIRDTRGDEDSRFLNLLPNQPASHWNEGTMRFWRQDHVNRVPGPDVTTGQDNRHDTCFADQIAGVVAGPVLPPSNRA